MNRMKRMWVNQPSKGQPDHALHGTHVLWDDINEVAYFIEGEVEFRDMLRSSLSPGWPLKHEFTQTSGWYACTWCGEPAGAPGQTIHCARRNMKAGNP